MVLALISVLLNADNIFLSFSGSPFSCNLFDTSMITINWEAIRTIPVNKPSAFNINVDQAPDAPVNVKIQGKTLIYRIEPCHRDTSY